LLVASPFRAALARNSSSDTSSNADPDLAEAGMAESMASLERAWTDEDLAEVQRIVRTLLHQRGNIVVAALSVASPLLLADLIPMLARSCSAAQRPIVLWLIKSSLSHQQASVRFGALEAALQLEDRTVLPALKRAAFSERVSDLRSELAAGVDYLQSL
jgi:hypothetical protein